MCPTKIMRLYEYDFQTVVHPEITCHRRNYALPISLIGDNECTMQAKM